MKFSFPLLEGERDPWTLKHSRSGLLSAKLGYKKAAASAMGDALSHPGRRLLLRDELPSETIQMLIN